MIQPKGNKGKTVVWVKGGLTTKNNSYNGNIKYIFIYLLKSTDMKMPYRSAIKNKTSATYTDMKCWSVKKREIMLYSE